MNASTIAAIATPPGHGGIGIVRLSGPQSLDIALSVFRIKRNAPFSDVDGKGSSGSFVPQSRYLYYGVVVDPDSLHVIDEALFTVMRAPHSYTGEDVVEMQSHAGPVALARILGAVLRKGAQPAGPGEFTRRAFLNGRIDLTQAEAVADLISARSEKAAEIAAVQVSGKLKRVIQALQATLHDMLTYIEAAIDFPEEVGQEIDPDTIAFRIDCELVQKLKSLMLSADQLRCLRDGIKMIIIGAPNVGKSSLMNRLLEKERAIVSDIPGTTRDFIEDAFLMNGMPVVVTDTAGIHETVDPVEQIGIDKAWAHISGADILLLTMDVGRAADAAAMGLFEKLSDTRKQIIVVLNKTDLPVDRQVFHLPGSWSENPRVEVVRVSALHNQGVAELKSLIADMVISSSVVREDGILINLRHKRCMETALGALENARHGLAQNMPFELIAIDLYAARDALSEITGESAKEDILDSIFSTFCIGK